MTDSLCDKPMHSGYTNVGWYSTQDKEDKLKTATSWDSAQDMRSTVTSGSMTTKVSEMDSGLGATAKLLEHIIVLSVTSTYLAKTIDHVFILTS